MAINIVSYIESQIEINEEHVKRPIKETSTWNLYYKGRLDMAKDILEKILLGPELDPKVVHMGPKPPRLTKL